jgi:hypothetical protein
LWFNLLVMIPFNFDVELDQTPVSPLITPQNADAYFEIIHYLEQVVGYTYEVVFTTEKIPAIHTAIQEDRLRNLNFDQMCFQF